MWHQSQLSGSILVWTFIWCFVRDLWDLKVCWLQISNSRRACGHVDVWTCPHQVLAATLTLSQPGGQIMPSLILVSTPSFESHRRAWTLLKPGGRLCPSDYYQSFPFKNYLYLFSVKSKLFTNYMFVAKIVQAHKPINWYVLFPKIIVHSMFEPSFDEWSSIK